MYDSTLIQLGNEGHVAYITLWRTCTFQYGKLLWKVAWSLFSSINQSAYSTLHWMSNSQSEHDGAAYAHHWGFPINGRIIPILAAQLTVYPMQNQWSCRKNSTIRLFQMSVIPKQGSIPAHNDLIVIVLTDIGRHWMITCDEPPLREVFRWSYWLL